MNFAIFYLMMQSIAQPSPGAVIDGLPDILFGMAHAQCIVKDAERLADDTSERERGLAATTAECRTRTAKMISEVKMNGKLPSEAWQKEKAAIMDDIEAAILPTVAALEDGASPRERVRVAFQREDGTSFAPFETSELYFAGPTRIVLELIPISSGGGASDGETVGGPTTEAAGPDPQQQRRSQSPE